MIALGVDLGGSHIACAIVRDREVLSKSVVPLDLDGRGVKFPCILDTVVVRLKQVASQAHVMLSEAAGLAFAFPGLVDSRNGRVIDTNEKFDDAREIDFAAWARHNLNVPIRLENDARLALIGEQYAGAARGFEDAAMILLGSGIGAATMLDGKPLRGCSDRAGCLGGHFPVVLGGRRCTCGNLGCAEAEASTRALIGIAHDMPGYASSMLYGRGQLDFAFVFECADLGDAVAKAILERCCAVWSALAVAMLHAYSPQILLFGGGVMARQDFILPKVREYVGRYAWGADELKIQPAALKSTAALLGSVPRLLEG